MKKVLFGLVFLMCMTFDANAQVTVAEPEFAEETMLLTSDSEGVLLKRENGSIKAKAGASMFLTGIGKIKSRLTLPGIKSVNTVAVPSNAALFSKVGTTLLIPILTLVSSNLMSQRKNVVIS